jgi:hypothetical protein
MAREDEYDYLFKGKYINVENLFSFWSIFSGAYW